MDQCRVEDPEVEITTCMLQRYLYTCTRTTKFAHMNGHWKAYDLKNSVRFKFTEIFEINDVCYIWVITV